MASWLKCGLSKMSSEPLAPEPTFSALQHEAMTLLSGVPSDAGELVKSSYAAALPLEI